MALVSEVAAAVVDPILYDSGWKRVKGDGTIQIIETLVYDDDAVVRVFGRPWESTIAQEWGLRYKYKDAGSVTFMAAWRDLTQPWLAPMVTTGALSLNSEYILDSGFGVITVTQPVAALKKSGLSLGKGMTATFESTAAATSSEGIEYRIVVERSTSAVMLGRAV